MTSNQPTHCHLLQGLLNPLASQEGSVYSGLISVISKMEWYIGMSRLRSRNAQDDLARPLPSLPDDDLIALYRSVLSYLMHAVVQLCLEKRKLEQISLESQLNEVIISEKRLAGTFGQLRLHSQFGKLREAAEKMARRDESPSALQERDLKTMLSIEQKQFSRQYEDKHDTGGLLYDIAKESSEFEDFVNWGDKDGCRILWVSGRPGTGKSILLKAMVSRLHETKDSNTDNNTQAPHYLCNNTFCGQASVLSAVKHLIYGVLRRQPDLQEHLEDAPKDWGGINSLEVFYHWSKILCNIISDVQFTPTFFVVDGVEQFLGDGDPDIRRPVSITDNESFSWDSLGKRDLVKLLRLISRTVELTDKVKWVLSVDDERCSIEPNSVVATSQRHLILDAADSELRDDVARVVYKYAADKVSEIGSDQHYHDIITATLTEKLLGAPSNFLWMDIALDIVRGSTAPWNTAAKLDDLVQNMSTIDSVYDSTIRSIQELPNAHMDGAYCMGILSATATAYRPLRLSELAEIIELPIGVEPAIIVSTWLSIFLEVFEGAIYFRHVSARDFIRRSMTRDGLQLEHYRISERCLTLLLGKLSCNHRANATYSNGAEIGMDYITTMWMKHLSELDIGGDESEATGLANDLLSFHLMDWLDLLPPKDMVMEALFLMFQLKAAIGAKVSYFLASARHRFDGTHLANLHPMNPQTRPPGYVDAYPGSFSEIIPEVITFMRSYRRWKIDEEGIETDTSKGSPMDLLLFSTDLHNLRKILLPIHFDCLAIYPQVNSQNSRGDSTHILPHSDWVRGCCFSPDGLLVATSCDDGRVHVWDAQTGNLQQVLGESDHYMRGVAISHLEVSDAASDNQIILTAVDGKEVHTWDVTGNDVVPLPSVTGDIGHVRCIAISSAAGKLVAGGDGGISVWNMANATWSRVPGFECFHEHSVRCVEFSPNGKLLASTSGPDITIWNADTGEVECTLPAKSTQPEATQGEGVPEGDEEAEAEEIPHGGHSDTIDGLAFSPDSKFLASGSDDRTSRIWSIDTRETVSILEYHTLYVNTVSFSSDGALLATGSSDDSIGIWKRKAPGDWGGGETRTRPDQVLHGHSSSVYKVSFSPYGRLLASASDDQFLRIWDLDRLDVKTCEAPPDPLPEVNAGPGHEDSVSCVAVSEDGRTVVSASNDGTICFWDGLTGRRQRTTDKFHQAEVLSMTFSPDGGRLVTTSIDASVFIWTIPKASESLPTPIRLNGHDDWVRDAKFDGRGQRVATGSDEGTVRVYDVSHITGHDIDPAKAFEYHEGYVYSVVFSPDGTHLASGDDLRVMVWRYDHELQSGPDENMTDDRVQSPMRTVVFSTDGRQVISLSKDRTIAIWRLGSTEGPKCRIVEEDPDFGQFRSMRIDPEYPDVILTELGALRVDYQAGHMTRKGPVKLYPPGWYALWLSRGATSITLREKMTISLPSFVNVSDEFFSCRVQRDVVVIGCTSGEVLLFRFAAREIFGED